jgi:DNA-binding NarL/FixJ family response regulator
MSLQQNELTQRGTIRQRSRRVLIKDGERMQALRMFCDGMCFKKIGAELGIRPARVSHHIVTLMRRYGVRTHAQLGIFVAKRGLV